jgi:hypothetical protein
VGHGTDLSGARQGLGGPDVEDQLELGRLLHWQISWLFALQDSAGVDAV